MGPAVAVVVQDTGIGIDAKHHKAIFEKFYQIGEVALHSSGKTTFKGGGPGLGLALVKGAIEAHGGMVWVESEGCNEQTLPGSAFKVLLPIHAPAKNNG
jgi:signal transduction histidine kinase